MRWLVTGSAGFVGGYLMPALESAGHQVWGFDLRRGCDVRDYERLRSAVEEIDPDRIVHLAAQAYVPESTSDPRRGLEVNTLGTLNLLEAVRHTGSRARLLLAGTSEEYGYDTQPGPEVTEGSPTWPTTPYGAAKLAAGQLGLVYARQWGIPVVVTRASNHTGPGHASCYALPSFARRVAEVEAGRSDRVVHGNLDAVRNYTDVRDVVAAYLLAIEAPPGVYNVCSDVTMSMAYVLDRLVSMARCPVKTEQDQALCRPAGGAFWPPSHAKLTRTTGWEPRIPLEQTLADLLDDWRARL